MIWVKIQNSGWSYSTRCTTKCFSLQLYCSPKFQEREREKFRAVEVEIGDDHKIPYPFSLNLWLKINIWVVRCFGQKTIRIYDEPELILFTGTPTFFIDNKQKTFFRKYQGTRVKVIGISGPGLSTGAITFFRKKRRRRRFSQILWPVLEEWRDFYSQKKIGANSFFWRKFYENLAIVICLVLKIFGKCLEVTGKCVSLWMTRSLSIKYIEIFRPTCKLVPKTCSVKQIFISVYTFLKEINQHWNIYEKYRLNKIGPI